MPNQDENKIKLEPNSSSKIQLKPQNIQVNVVTNRYCEFKLLKFKDLIYQPHSLNFMSCGTRFIGKL